MSPYIIPKDAINRLIPGKILQEVVGFSDETLVRFYEAASSILDQRRFEDAINSFFFLTALNPYLSELWQGLAMSYQQNQEYENALDAYSVAYTLEGKKLFSYAMAAQCCIEMKEFDKAHTILDKAIYYAEENNLPKLKQDAQSAKAYVYAKGGIL